MSGDGRFGSVEIDWEAEPVPNLARFDGYDEALRDFEFDVPATFNIATDVVSRHAEKRGRVAMIQRIQLEDGTDEERTYTFWQFERWSNRMASALSDRGVERGDRVAIVASRSDRVLCTHLAAWKLGAVTVPLSVLYGPDGLEYRLSDSEPTAVVLESGLFEAVEEAIADLDTIELLVGTDRTPPDPVGVDVEAVAMDDLTGGASPGFDAVETAPDDPAFILYTSGTTGRPKGILQDHQTLIGWLPGFQMCFELPWHDADPFLYATPDLAWIGGINLVLGSLHYGFPVFRYESSSGFDPTVVFENIERYGPTRAVLVPGMLKPMSKLDASEYDLESLVVVMSGSEPVSESLHEYVTETLDANLNEMYGQTEALHVVSSCTQWHDADPGSLGYTVPGHEVAIVDESGETKPHGEVGIIGLQKPDPAMFNELWNDPDATERKFVGDGRWMNTDDLGYRDESGQLWFKSRADDLIITHGYRIGPAEVEESILQLEEVRNVGVIGIDDDERGEIVAAFVEVADDATADAALEERIQNHVRERLAKYEYPRRIEFVDELPKTVTGKIQRHELEQLVQSTTP